jgi:hypothetical protein
VSEGLIRVQGMANPLANARRQQEIVTPRFGRPTGDRNLIHGELATFTDLQRNLPPIDRLEGFRPGGTACTSGRWWPLDAGTLQLQYGFTGWLGLQMGSELTGSGGVNGCWP